MTTVLSPSFSPAMLALFVTARGVAGMALGDLAKLAGVSPQVAGLARAGRLKQAGHRAALWAALGLFPADFNLVLTDDGGQFSSASRADASGASVAMVSALPPRGDLPDGSGMGPRHKAEDDGGEFGAESGLAGEAVTTAQPQARPRVAADAAEPGEAGHKKDKTHA